MIAKVLILLVVFQAHHRVIALGSSEYNSQFQLFVCEKPGNFKNPSDISCKTFYQCTNFLGNLTPIPLTCPIFTNFDPESQTCSLTYACPVHEGKEPTDKISNTRFSDYEYPIDPEMEVIKSCTLFKCPSEGIFGDPDTCGKYYVCNKLLGTYIANHNPCPLFAGFDPMYKMCSFAKACLPPIEECTPQDLQSHEESCTYVDYPDYFHCTRSGLFRNLNDPKCKTYHSCKYTGTGTFFKETYQCSSGTTFNPFARKCDSNYICPCNGISGTTSPHITIDGVDSAKEMYENSLKMNGDSFERNDSVYMSFLIQNNESQLSRIDAQSDNAVEESEETNSGSDILSEFSLASLHSTSFAECDPSLTQSFECNRKGRFQDSGDASCRSYFLCNHLRNGSFVKTRYTCPKSSRFNPNLGVCHVHYKCPCESKETTTITTTTTTSKEDSCLYEEDADYFTCTRKGRYENLNDPTCQSYFLCNLLRNGSFLKTKYSCPKDSYFDRRLGICSKQFICPCKSLITTQTTTAYTSTTTDATTEIGAQTSLTTERICNYGEVSNYSSCSRKGRFENLNDMTCQTYYLCNLLRNGSFIKTQYFCPKGSRFNPSLSVCDTNYICPCEAYSTTSPSTTSRIHTIPTTASNEITEADDLVTTEGFGCDYQKDPEYFICVDKGRFKNLNDPTCQSYFLCNLLRNGSFVKTKYICPSNSYFHPGFGICSTKYICPCTSQISTQSTTVHISTVEATTETNPQTVMTTERACNYGGNSEYFSCPRKGRFENLNDITCQSYYLCNSLRNGSFVKTRYSCPKGSHFNPSLSVCDTRYICPCEVYSTTFPSTNTVASTVPTKALTDITETNGLLTTEKPGCDYQKDPEYFICVEKGRFENLNDLTCQSYFLCNLLRNGSFVKTKYPCPENSYFHPGFGICSTKYICPCKSQISTQATTVHISTITDKSTEITPQTAITTERDCNYGGNSENFSCARKGRFENLKDMTCQSYYLCNSLRNGSFIKTSYLCPKGSRFNPSLSVCDTHYICPCEAYSNTSPTTYSFVTTVPTTEITNDPLTTEGLGCDYRKDPDYFMCIKKGRFENLNDPTCQSYFLCNLLRNGSFVKTKYLCPKMSYFHPAFGICSTKFICPCKSEITTQPTTHDATTTHGSTEKTSQTAITTVRVCDDEANSYSFNCLRKGRFENLNDLTCQSYYLCNLLRNGTFIRTKYSCPKGSHFNPSLSVCDTQYTCPCEAHRTTPASSTIDVSTISTTTTTTKATEADELSTIGGVTTSITEGYVCNYRADPNYFVCSKKGRFENLNDAECQSYYLCNLLRNGSYIRTKYNCPNGSRFNPSLSVCDIRYTCPCDTGTTTITTVYTTHNGKDSNTTYASTETAVEVDTGITTVESVTDIRSTEADATACSTSAPTERACVYEEDPDYFICTANGAYENQNDPTCQTYFLCTLLRNGTLLKTKHLCPKGLFNPYLRVCDSSFKCPCESLTTTGSHTVTDSYDLKRRDGEST